MTVSRDDAVGGRTAPLCSLAAASLHFTASPHNGAAHPSTALADQK
jgi:hypothetical protein